MPNNRSCGSSGLKGYSLLLFFCLQLVSCGGGGGGAASAVSGLISGVAIDGALYRATAFLDLNGNGRLDAGEPSATTGTDGGYTLSATQEQVNSHSVVVTAVAGTTIDQDSPGTAINSGMTLVAPAGYPGVVSPLTTQVAAKIASGLTLAAAKSAVQTELGLASIDVMKNFVTEKNVDPAYANAHKIATAVAEVLKSVDTESDSNTTLAEKLTSVVSKVTNQVAPNAAQIKSATSISDAKTVINVVINNYIAASSFDISGSISGLNTAGLILTNGTDNLVIAANATSFAFRKKLADADAYQVRIKSQPNGQICTLGNASGIVANRSVTNVAVSCGGSSGDLAGTVSGLISSGLVLTNGSEQLSVSQGATAFKFINSPASGTSYSISVQSQPTGATCSVSNATGTMSTSVALNIQVTCSSNSYSLSGTITGLDSSGLKLKSGSEILTINHGATGFTFSTKVAYGGGYSVTIDSQPTNRTCSLTNSSGAMGVGDVSTVQVTCAVNQFMLSGTVSGLNVDGLVLKNGSETIRVSSYSNSFIFTQGVAAGGAYAVTVDVQPSYPIGCTVTNGSGSEVTASVSNINVMCAPIPGAVVLYAGQNRTSWQRGYVNGPSSSALFQDFESPVISSDGTLYFADTTSHAVRQIGPTGVFATFAGNPIWQGGQTLDGTGTAARFNNVAGLVFDASGNLFVADYGDRVIRKITPSAVVTTYAGVLRAPDHTLADGIGTSAVFNLPLRLTADSWGNLYVLDENTVRKISSQRVVTTLAGKNGYTGSVDGTGSNALLNYESGGLACDSAGNIFMTDSRNHTIRKITPNGVVTTFAGTSGVAGNVDGLGVLAKFSYPVGIVIDSSDNIYVADRDNNLIRKVTPNGQVSTYAGNGSRSGIFVEGSKGSVTLGKPGSMAIDSNRNIFVFIGSTSSVVKIIYSPN